MSSPDDGGSICRWKPPCSTRGISAAIHRDDLECFKGMLTKSFRDPIESPETLLDCASVSAQSIYLWLRRKGVSASEASLRSVTVVAGEWKSTRWCRLRFTISTAAKWDSDASLDREHLDTFERRIMSRFSPPISKLPPEFDVLTCDTDWQCSICEQSDPPDRIGPRCGHGFHPACLIRRMLNNNNTCPECDMPILQTGL